jgi:uncharacterized protein YceH (UPF0502 family)
MDICALHAKLHCAVCLEAVTGITLAEMPSRAQLQARIEALEKEVATLRETVDLLAANLNRAMGWSR